MLSRYGYLGPGSRLRMYQYLPYLRSQGLEITVSALLDDAYVRRLYSRLPVQKTRVMAAYLARLGHLLRARGRYDLLWIQWELFPWLPAIAEIALGSGVAYVADYDDAIFHRYDLHSSALVRAVLGRKIDAVMARAKVVVVGNDYLKARALQAGARHVMKIPTVIDLDRYRVVPDRDQDPFVVGWIGTNSTAGYLNLIAAPLAQFCARRACKLVVVGVRDIQLPGVEVECRPWTEETEVSEIQTFDVGIMPLSDEPWSRGKCGYKLIQYMACGKPVIASPVGINRDIVQPGVHGYLAESDAEWLRALEGLADSPARRQSMGQEARKQVEHQYCLQVTGPQLHAVFQQAAGRP